MATHILFETSTGFSVFSLQGTDQIQNAQTQKSMADFEKFSKCAKMIGTLPFTSAAEALENINSISEGILTDSLHSFLKQTLKKATDVLLGVSDNKLAASIQEGLSINCISNTLTAEIIRFIRFHINSFTKLKDQDLIKAQLGLGHSYSRSKVKFNVHKVDNMIIQAISMLEQLDKDLNTFYMRVREWYSWHFPELIKIVKENIHFARLVKLIENKSSVNEELIPQITEIVGDEALARDVLTAAKASMGTDISTIDLESILHFANRVISLAEYRLSLEQYLTKKMKDIAPNLQTLIGDRVGAKLIAKAGSLTNLAKYPASTVQILGAEKALFRAMKVRGKTPKYGIIYNSGFIAKATPKNKGKISRCLANKVSIATRIDCFSDNPTDRFGAVLKRQVDDRLEFFTNGVAPKRNIDVMREVIKEVEEDFPMSVDAPKKSSKKQKVEEKEEKVEEKKSSKKEKKEEKVVEEKKSSKKSKKSEEKEEDAMEVEAKPAKKSSKKEKKEEVEEKPSKKSKKSEEKEEKVEDKKSSKKSKKFSAAAGWSTFGNGSRPETKLETTPEIQQPVIEIFKPSEVPKTKTRSSLEPLDTAGSTPAVPALPARKLPSIRNSGKLSMETLKQVKPPGQSTTKAEDILDKILGPKMTDVLQQKRPEIKPQQPRVSIYHHIDPDVERQIHDIHTRKAKLVTNYPQLYNKKDSIDISTMQPLSTDPRLRHESTLLQLGTCLVFDRIPMGTDIPTNRPYYPSPEQVGATKGYWTKKAIPTLSNDPNIQPIVDKHNVDIVLSSSTFLKLINNHPPFIEEWEIPVISREYKNSLGETRKVSILDKPLLKKKMTNKERNEKFFNLAIESMALTRGDQSNYPPIHFTVDDETDNTGKPRNRGVAPEGTNLTYNTWTLGTMIVLVRCKIHGLIPDPTSTRKVRNIGLKTKVEFFPDKGLEDATVGDTSKWWLYNHLRPDAHLILARVNVWNRKLISLEKKDAPQIRHAKCQFQPEKPFKIIIELFKRVHALPLEHCHLLSHSPNDNFVHVYQSIDEESVSSDSLQDMYNLHKEHMAPPLVSHDLPIITLTPLPPPPQVIQLQQQQQQHHNNDIKICFSFADTGQCKHPDTCNYNHLTQAQIKERGLDYQPSNNNGANKNKRKAVNQKKKKNKKNNNKNDSSTTANNNNGGESYESMDAASDLSYISSIL
eukprot:gene7997-9392_t